MEPRTKLREVRWNAGSTIDPPNGEESISPKSLPTSQLPLWSTTAWTAGRTLDPLNRDDGISPRSVPTSQLPLPPTAPPAKPFQPSTRSQTSMPPGKKALQAEDKPILNDRSEPWDALAPDNPIIGDMASIHLWGSSNVRRIVDQNVRQFPEGPDQSPPLQPTSGYQYDFNSSPSEYGNFVPNPALPPSNVYAGAGYLPSFECANLAPQFNSPPPSPSFNAPDVGHNALASPSWHHTVLQPTPMIQPSVGQHETS